MARIFLSHSSSDNDLARALRDWLVAEGWNDLFLDFDPERGISAGEKWEKALLDAAGRCEAVLFVVTRNWLGSGWCLKEFHLAEKLNKRMFMLLVDGLKVPDLPPELTAEWQLVDLEPGSDTATFPVSDGISAPPRMIRFSNVGLRRLRSGLHKAGLDPRFFAWPPEKDPNRPPYRGLKALEADDAGIFFGREAQTVAALDRMRGLRDAAPPRFLAILGASGAGKSSFLRAGLLPRLQRDDRHFCALPVIRPERAAMNGENGLVRALVTMFERVSNGISRKQIEELIAIGPTAVIRILARLANVMRVPALTGEPPARAPTLVLSIDQGEELFNADGGAEAAQLLGLLRDLCTTPDLNLIVLVSIRSDSYERLQTAPQLDGLRQETLSLPPMPRGAYETVINGPARRLSQSGRRLVVEPALTQQLLGDIEAGGAKDALPLLAFTLELLYANHGQDGKLTLADYAALGGIKGSIEVAVERALAAADSDPRVPKDHDQRLALMRRAFIPWLAGTDLATNTVRRRVARMSEVPEEARPLVECLIAARLLSTDVTLDGAVTVEPAHEALLRQWGTLQGWLEEDFAAMAALAGVQRAARDWEANARDPGWLSHAAGRLEDAEASDARDTLKGFLGESEHAYLAACRVAEDEQRNRELEEARKLAESRALTVKRTRIGLAVASALFVAASGIGWYATVQRDEAQRQETRAREEAIRAQASLSVVKSREARSAGHIGLASREALAGFRLLANTETRSNLLEVGLAISPHLQSVLPTPPGLSVSAVDWIGPGTVAVAGKEGRTTVLDTLTLHPDAPPALTGRRKVPKVMFDGEDEAEIVALRTLSGGMLMAARNSGTIELYRPGDAPPLGWTPPPRQSGHDYPHVAIAPDGRSLVLGGTNGAVFAQCAPLAETATALSCAMEDPVAGQVTAVAYSPDGRTAYVAFEDGTILTGGGDTPRERSRLIEPNVVVRGLAPSGKVLAAMVQMTGPRATPGLSLVLLSRLGNSWDMALRAPVNIGSAPNFAWRIAGQELIHNCLSTALTPGPLCATRMEGEGEPPAWSTQRRHSGHVGQPNLIAVSPDGSRIITRGTDGLAIWHWPANHSFATLPALAERGGWAGLSALADGSRIELTARDGRGLMLDPALDYDAQKPLPTVEGDVIDAIPLPDGRVVATEAALTFLGGGEGSPPRSLELAAPIRPRGGLVYTGKDRIVALALTDWRIGLVDFSNETPEFVEFSAPEGKFEPFGITVDRSRNQLVASGADGRILLFDLASRKPVGVLENTHEHDGTKLLGAEGLAVSADGRLLATTARGNRVMLYDLARRTSLALLRLDEGSTETDTKSVAFDAAGRHLAVIDQANQLGLWQTETLDQPLVRLKLQTFQANGGSTEPVLLFARSGPLVILTKNSEVVSLNLDEAGWVRRIESLRAPGPATGAVK